MRTLVSPFYDLKDPCIKRRYWYWIGLRAERKKVNFLRRYVLVQVEFGIPWTEVQCANEEDGQIQGCLR